MDLTPFMQSGDHASQSDVYCFAAPPGTQSIYHLGDELAALNSSDSPPPSGSDPDPQLQDVRRRLSPSRMVCLLRLRYHPDHSTGLCQPKAAALAPAPVIDPMIFIRDSYFELERENKDLRKQIETQR